MSVIHRRERNGPFLEAAAGDVAGWLRTLESSGPVTVRCFSSALRAALVPQLPSERFALAEGLALGPSAAWADQARTMLLERLVDQEETMKERRVLFAASDGAAHPVYGNGAYAWVSASGRFEVGRAPRHIMMAELTGITKFAKQIPFEVFSKAVLFVDSLRAIDTITAHSSVLWKLPDQEAMMQTLSMIEGGRLELVWVKSHNGHVLNDVADRLALMRHRAVRMALTESEIAAAAERIIDQERENLLAPQWPVERLRALKAWRQLERTHASQRTAALV